VRDSEDAWPALREFAYRTHRVPDGTRWSYHRDLGNTRLLMIDSRGGRVLDEGHRSMVDAEEWAWISDKATGDFDHLLFGTSLPLLLGPAMHHLQTWDERLCSGAWGSAPPAGLRAFGAPRTSTTGPPSTTLSPRWWV
jgi:hypothetical protein